MKSLANHIQTLNARYDYNPATGELRDRTRDNAIIKSPRLSLAIDGTTHLIPVGRAIYTMMEARDIPQGGIIRYRDGDMSNRKWENIELSTYTALNRKTWQKQTLAEHFDTFHECFDYDAHTGDLTWKERPAHHFLSSRARNIFNVKFQGKKAGTPQAKDGRLQIHMTVRGEKLHAYTTQIIWVMLNRCDPPKGFLIDHKDRRNQNDSKANLRLASPSQNAANMSRAPGISGHRGVYLHGNKFYAQIRLKNPKVSIGKLFNKLEDAVAFRKSLEKKYFGDFRV